MNGLRTGRSRLFLARGAESDGVLWLNLKHESDLEQMARHDLWWSGLGFGLQLRRDGEGVSKAMGYMERARQERDEYPRDEPEYVIPC